MSLCQTDACVLADVTVRQLVVFHVTPLCQTVACVSGDFSLSDSCLLCSGDFSLSDSCLLCFR